jgi:ring-1,2-phenylacetyl-CoA epoxidase subunit PaaC
MKQYLSPEEAKKDQAYLEAVTELLFQLADDDLMISQRGAEWLGLAPHIEEDVAFASISQDNMGHAAMFYQMLEDIGAGKADDLAYLREADEFRNAILTERVNGEGHYIEEPNYDWAYAIIRNYAYEVFKKIRLDALEKSSYGPLVDIAQKMKKEQFYHLYHWEIWIDQLASSTNEARRRLNAAVEKTWEDVSTLFDLGPKAKQLVQLGLMESSDAMKAKFMAQTQKQFENAGLYFPGEPQSVVETGRDGNHSGVLEDALVHMSSVYRLAPQASW